MILLWLRITVLVIAVNILGGLAHRILGVGFPEAKNVLYAGACAVLLAWSTSRTEP